jgi:hypothetical protein
MLEFIRSQEADLMLNMSRLNPNTENFFQKQNQFLELQSIKGAVEQSLIEKKVSSALSHNNTSILSPNNVQII